MTARTALPANPFPVPERALPRLARLDEYRIEQVLAQSSFGVVYRAHDTVLGLQVAIKEYLPDALALRGAEMQVLPRSKAQAEGFERGRKAFIDEAQRLARCDHPSLVHVTRILHQHGTVYRVMRHCPGPTLLAQRRDSAEAPSAATVRAWLDALLGALHTLHDAGCVHGAVAPGNILIGPAGRPVLLDFEAVSAALISDRTQSMMVALEPCFAPIEQREPSAMMPLGPWTDLYSLAATLHFCISGHLPAAPAHDGTAAAFEPLALLWQRRGVALDDASARLAAAIDACLLEWPQHRPQSVAAFQALLDGRGARTPVAAAAHVPGASAVTAGAPPAPVISTATTRGDDGLGAQLIADLDQAFARIAAGAQDDGTPSDGGSVAGDAPASAATPLASDLEATRTEPALMATPSTPSAPPAQPMEDDWWQPSVPPGTPGEGPPGEADDGSAPVAALRNSPKARSLHVAGALAALAFVGLVFALADWGPNTGGSAAPSPERATNVAPRPADRAPPPKTAAASPPIAPQAPQALQAPQDSQRALVGLPAPAAGPAQPSAAVDAAAAQPIETAAEPPKKPEPPRPAKVTAAPKAKALPGPASPREVCGNRTQFSLYQCMQTQCASAKWSAHAQCVRLRNSDSVD